MAAAQWPRSLLPVVRAALPQLISVPVAPVAEVLRQASGSEPSAMVARLRRAELAALQQISVQPEVAQRPPSLLAAAREALPQPASVLPLASARAPQAAAPRAKVAAAPPPSAPALVP